MKSTNQRLAVVEDKLALDKCWREHEGAIHKQLDAQGEIIDSYLDPTKDRGYGEGFMHKAQQQHSPKKQQKRKEGDGFSKFWKLWCQKKQFYAVLFFYLGTGFMLLAVMIFMFVINSQTYLSMEGAVLSAVIIGIFLLLSLWLAIYLPFYDAGGSSRLLKKEEEEEAKEGEEEEGGDDEEDGDDDVDDDEGDEEEEDS